MHKWERLNPDDEVDVTADMTALTLDTIALCGFDYRFNSFYRDTQHPFVDAMVRRAGGEPGHGAVTADPEQAAAQARGSCAEDYRFMDAMVQKIIDERRQSGNAQDQRRSARAACSPASTSRPGRS